MRTLAWIVLGASVELGCANSIVGLRDPLDGAAPDVGPGLNPDGQDPFRPTDGGVIVVDADVEDTGAWQLPDVNTVFDQRYGYIFVGSILSGAEEASYVSAEFRLVPRPEDPRCSYLSAANWDFITCSQTGEGPRDLHPTPYPSAGQISVTGGNEVVRIQSMSTGTYTPYYASRVVFSGPRVVRVSARGGAGVPAFEADVPLPPPLQLTQPDLSSGAVTIDRTRDLVLTWRPNQARSVTFSLSHTVTVGSETRTVYLNADFYGNAGMAVIPARLLMRMPAASAGATASFTMTPRNIIVQQVGPWPLQFTGAGRGVQGRAVLQ